MPDSLETSRSRSPQECIEDEIERLTDHASGVVDLGYALAKEPGRIDEAACAACRNVLPEYIEAELSGRPARRLFPQVARHLDICLDCGQMYVDLLEIGLQTEAGPLPVPATELALDLSFLPPLSLFEQIRSVVEALVKGLASQWPQALADLAWAAPDFFNRVQALGPGPRPRLAPEFALGFGGELPPVLQLLAATYGTTYAVVHELSVEELEAELRGDRPAHILKKQARIFARDAGMGRREARRWVDQYVDLARVHAEELLALARLVRQDEREDEPG